MRTGPFGKEPQLGDKLIQNAKVYLITGLWVEKSTFTVYWAPGWDQDSVGSATKDQLEWSIKGNWWLKS